MIDVYWWSKVRLEKDTKENFGDVLVPFLLKRITTQKFRWSLPNKRRLLKVFKKKHYLMIGSIIRSANSHSVVWGSGIINTSEDVKKATFLAVRGPHTRKRLLDLGYNVPEKYGDPALLLALFYKQNKRKITYKYGIIPHYVDYEETYKLYANNQDVLVIDLLTNNPEDVINNMLECENILSSSLHGIIVAHALEIPALWVKISDKLYGDDIKFYDYFDSIKLKEIKSIAFKRYSLEELNSLFIREKSKSLPKKKDLNKLLLDLVNTFPLRKSKAFKEAIKQISKL